MTEKQDNTAHIKQKLFELYSANHERLFNLQSDMNVEGPYLICPSESYLKAPTKISICGQQTQGWETFDNIEQQMETHLHFDSGTNYLGGRTPFHQFTSKLLIALNMSNYRATQLNLNKYDYEASTPPPEMRTKLSSLDDILLGYCVKFSA